MPEAVTLNVALLPVQTEAFTGWVVIVIAVLIVNVATSEFIPAAVQAPGPFTIQRYWLLFIAAVTADSVSVAVVTAGLVVFHVVPPSALTSHLFPLPQP